jgi:hypothetical protein
MSISSGAVTTGTPLTTSRGYLPSYIRVTSAATSTAALNAAAAGFAAAPGPLRRRESVDPARSTTRIGREPDICQYKHEKNLAFFLSRAISSRSMSNLDETGGSWTLLTGHGHVLVEIARNPGARAHPEHPGQRGR